MKRIISIVLMAVMVLAMAGCSGSADSAPAATTAAPAAAAPAPETTAAPAAEKLSGTVSTDGSTSMEKVIGVLKESFEAANSGVSVTYNPTGSGTGIQAVQEGRCDIGLSSRALKAAEEESGLVGTTLAIDGIAVIVNPENTVEDLDVETIAKIYTGE
ncbi:MAG: substrate-binding domain-containing protein, partial [Faecousia sp.]